MHLRIIEIENFRGIKRLELKLNVVTAVFGEGSFGKTSLLDALELCLGTVWQKTANTIPKFAHSDFHQPRDGGQSPARKLAIRLVFRESTPEQWDSMLNQKLMEAAREWRTERRQITLSLSANRMDDATTFDGICEFLAPDGKVILQDRDGSVLASLRKHVPLVILEPPVLSRFRHNVQEIGIDQHETGQKISTSVYDKALFTPELLTEEDLDKARKDIEALPEVLSEVLLHSLERITTASTERALANAPINNNQLSAALTLVDLFNRAIPENITSWDMETQPIIAAENIEANLHPILLSSLWNLLAQLPTQKLLVTNSDELLSAVPLRSLRRVCRHPDGLVVHFVQEDSLSTDDLRRIGYHLRLNRSDAIMSRCWLLVEGESEFWLVPELGHVLGFDLKAEGIRCVEFAQCGVEPLIRVAEDLGIGWHLLADGDQSGKTYARLASEVIREQPLSPRVTILPDLDIEHHLCRHGFLEVYERAAGRKRDTTTIKAIIQRATKRKSKPALILAVTELVSQRGRDGISRELRHVVETAVEIARRTI